MYVRSRSGGRKGVEGAKRVETLSDGRRENSSNLELNPLNAACCHKEQYYRINIEHQFSGLIVFIQSCLLSALFITLLFQSLIHTLSKSSTSWPDEPNNRNSKEQTHKNQLNSFP